MSVQVKLVDNSALVKRKVKSSTDLALGLMAAAIETRIKLSDGKTPFKKGALRASARHKKLGIGKYQVTVGEGSTAASYAAAQEAGRAGNRVFVNYTTPGTGPGFFREAINEVLKEKDSYIVTANRTSGMEEL